MKLKSRKRPPILQVSLRTHEAAVAKARCARADAALKPGSVIGTPVSKRIPDLWKASVSRRRCGRESNFGSAMARPTSRPAAG